MAEILATYRLQLHAGFPLARARELIPYLQRLGITHLHCSPLLQARRGSAHGYDVTDPTRLNPELGSEEELATLVEELHARGMGIVLDIVPNHMAASCETPAWEDVLTHGPASRYARWFDVEWRAPERELRFKVLLPVLGDQRARVLQRSEIRVVLEDGTLRVRYYDHSFPLDPGTIAGILDRAVIECEQTPDMEAAPCGALREISARLRRLPRRTARRAAAIGKRRQVAAESLGQLRELCLASPAASGAIERSAAALSTEESVERLRRLLDAQAYRLVYWRRAAREINYRRFFDINDLVGLHMEDPEVFDETHALVLEWRRRGWIDGFRIDHPDGLLDPLGYLRRLSGAASPAEGGEPPPVFVEKILSPGERLRLEWPVAGTTGYDFLNQVESLFVSPEGYHTIEQDYRRIIRQPLEFHAIARLAKRRVLESGLAAGVQRLAQRLGRLSGTGRASPAVRVAPVGRSLVETIASLPVYRTYVDASTPVPAGDDRRLLEAALSDARLRGRATAEALDLVEAALLALESPMRSPANEGLRLRLVQRFQQLSGPATAKGIEDTAFYSYAPLLSRNEVGGSPEILLDRAPEELHAGNELRARLWPRAMLAVTTHDTKRTADVRSRLDVLSEIPEDWAATVERWRGWNRVHKRELGNGRAPDPNTVYHVMQALVGIWPPEDFPDRACLDALRERIQAYANKSAKEAKLRTSWTDPDVEFEDALRCYVDALLDPDRSPRFLQDLGSFVRRIARAGMWNGLSRTLLHLASPGVPDIYQGDELWNLALVDPDNRRPVDYQRRVTLLAEAEERFVDGDESRHDYLAEIMHAAEDGRLKLHLIRAVLRTRQRYPDLFRSPTYHPIHAVGPVAAHVFGFTRSIGTSHLIVLAPRLLAKLVLDGQSPTASSIWQDTTVALQPEFPREWICALSGDTIGVDSGGTLRVADAFRRLPVALLLA